VLITLSRRCENPAGGQAPPQNDMELIQQAWHIISHLQDYLSQWTSEYGDLTYGILFLIIFCETGLVIAPFLPGDSLLFVAGSLCSSAGANLSLPILCVILPVAAITGDNLNYWIGRFIGPRVFKKEKSVFFNTEILHRTHTFYEKHGRKTVILARFVPLVRTFAPFVAGVGKMDYIAFLLYGIIGAFMWVFICAGAGYVFGNTQFVKDHFELIILAVIAISISPAAIAWIQTRRVIKREQKGAALPNE